MGGTITADRNENIVDEEASDNYKILVLEDEQAISKMLTRILTKLGHHVDCVESGEEVLQLYAKDGYDFVILDLIIPPPRLGGEETIKALKKLDPSVRAIVSSGYSGNSIIGNYSAFGFKAALPKPYNLAQLNQAIGLVMK